MAIRIQLRRDTAANWTSANPVLLAGEIGIETDTLQFKIGNGNNWNSITDYANTTPADLSTSLEDYILLSDRGAANGVASLNSSTKVPNTQIDDTYYATVSSVTSAVNALDEDLSGQIGTLEETVTGIATDISDINTAAGTLASTVSGHTTDISDLDAAKAPKASPTFTGDVVLPSTTTIGDVSSTEISYINGVTSGIQSQLDSKASSTSLSSHATDTTDIHGIADTSLLVTTTGTQTISNKTLSSPTITVSSGYTVVGTETGFEVSTYPVSAGVTGINFYKYPFPNSAGVQVGDTVQAYKSGETEINSKVWTVVNIDTVFGSLDATIDETYSYNNDGYGNTGFELKKVTGSSSTVSATEISYLDGVTSAIQTQLDAKASSSTLSSHASDTTDIHGIADTSVLLTTAGGTVDSLTITGNLTVNGTTTTVDTANLEVTDSLIYLASEQFDTDALDIGIFGAYGDVQTGHFHTGVVRDASDGKWKLVSNAPEPVDNAIDFSGVTYDTMKVGGIEFSDGAQTKEGVPSRTPIINKTESYTLSSLSERDSMIEVASSSGTTITIPTNSAVAFPIGASIDICQTSTGQVTIAGDSGVTVNSTPGLKLRTQWSTATLFKRDTNTWLVYGDLTA
jgi:hypothetical protein